MHTPGHIWTDPGLVLRMESYGAMVEAVRAGGRAILELWPLGTEALARFPQKGGPSAGRKLRSCAKYVL